MILTDQIKILDDKIKSNQAQYDLGKEAAKISALSSKNLLDRYESLIDEDLGYKPKVFEKLNLSFLHWACHSIKHSKKMRLKVLLRARVISIVIATTSFSSFTKALMNLKTCD